MNDNEPKPERMQRPIAERTEPARNMSSLLGGGVAKGPDPQVAEGVSAGYRVIEEYLRQGQEAARTVWMGGVPGLGGVGGRGEAEIAATASQMLRYSTELAAFWTGLLNNAMRPGPIGEVPRAQAGAGAFDFGAPVAPPRPAAAVSDPAPFAPPFTAPFPTPASEQPSASPASFKEPLPITAPAGILLAIDSKRPIEVSVQLNPGASLSALRVHDLRGKDDTAPRLRGLSAELQGGSVRVALRVPDDQPPGVYSGMIVDDETNLPAGTLSVRLVE